MLFRYFWSVTQWCLVDCGTPWAADSNKAQTQSRKGTLWASADYRWTGKKPKRSVCDLRDSKQAVSETEQCDNREVDYGDKEVNWTKDRQTETQNPHREPPWEPKNYRPEHRSGSYRVDEQTVSEENRGEQRLATLLRCKVRVKSFMVMEIKRTKGRLLNKTEWHDNMQLDYGTQNQLCNAGACHTSTMCNENSQTNITYSKWKRSKCESWTNTNEESTQTRITHARTITSNNRLNSTTTRMPTIQH